MAKKKIIGNESSESIIPSLSENSFPNAANIFKNGIFDISTNQEVRIIRNLSDKLTTFSKPITLDTLNLNIEQSEEVSSFTSKISLNYDKENLNNYARYGSLYERLRVSIENIISNWLGSLYVNNFNEGNFYDTIRNYSYSSVTNEASFSAPTFLIENKFDLIYTTSLKELSANTNSIKNLILNFDKYEVFDIISNTSTPILNIAFPSSKLGQSLNITVKGDFFSTASGGTASRSYHIRPKESEFNRFYKNLTNLEQQLLNIKSSPKYTFTAKLPQQDDDGNLYFERVNYTWLTSDGYNIDIDSNSYREYLTSILTLGSVYDQFKSDVIYRLYTPLSLKMFDNTESGKLLKYNRILGSYIDEIKVFIDGLANATTLTYNKKDNLADKFVKNFARTLGWSTTDLFDEENLLNSFFSPNTSGSTEDKLSASDLDIELWRRLALNSANLWKSKGTRKAIEFIFAFMGVPNCLIELNEYIYTVDGQINPNTVDLNQIFPLNQQLKQLPFDKDGFPVAPSEIPTYFFQISGNTDFGQTYIDLYKKLGFEVNKVEDNKKSWVYSETATTRNFDFKDSETSYNIESSKLILNTKEVGFTIDPIKAIECDVYNYNKVNNYPVSSTGRTFPYPQSDLQKIDVSTLTFNEYVSEIYSKFINVQNRKTVTDYNGGSYPTLKKLYFDYLNRSLSEGGSQSNAITLSKIFSYTEKVQKYIDRFIDQLIPATTIRSGDGIKIRNLVFTPQKFAYKHGINAGSEFQDIQPTNKEGIIKIVTINGTVNQEFKGLSNIYEASGFFTYNCDGFDSNVNDNALQRFGTTLNIEAKSTFFLSDFETPSFTLDKATKITTGSTPSDSIYLFDQILSGKTIDFNFSGNTSILSSSTRETKFIYDIHKYNSSISGFSSASTYNKEFKYTDFTSSTIFKTDVIPKAVLSGDSEYLIKAYYVINEPNVNTGETITAKTPLSTYETFHQNVYPLFSNSYERYFDDSLISGYTGISINLKPEYDINLPYLIYDNTLDYYFVSLNDIQQPTINVNGTFEGNQSNEYIVETVSVNSFNRFTISFKPAGAIEVHVNGSTLSSSEYNVVAAPQTLQNRIWQLLPNINSTDVVTVGYLKGSSSIDFAYDTEQITVIPSGTTQQLPNKILYNTATTVYDFFLSADVSGNTSNVFITYNGSTLQNGTDFVLSSSDNSKIVLNGIIPQSGDTINAYYITGGTVDLIEIISNPHTFSWEVANLPITTGGTFTFFIDDLSGSTIYSSQTQYIISQSVYNKTIDFNDPVYSALTAGQTYQYRVKNYLPYERLNGSLIDREKFSTYQKFKIPF